MGVILLLLYHDLASSGMILDPFDLAGWTLDVSIVGWINSLTNPFDTSSKSMVDYLLVEKILHLLMFFKYLAGAYSVYLSIPYKSCHKRLAAL